MRRASRCAALLALALPLAASSAPAQATPSVKFRAKAVPIPHFRHTGLKFGAGAAVEAEYLITGTEYEGSPPPLAGINFYLPKGTKLHTSGFPTCAKSVLEPSGVGPKGCSKSSHAGPTGEALGYVTLGGERVHEKTTIESFYAPGGGLEFFTAGHSPVSLEILSTGHYKNLHGAGGFGPELETEIPLVASVPGAPYASVERIKVRAGSAMRRHGKTIYYGRVPTRCPKHYFPVKSEVIFAEVGGLPRQVVSVTYKAPCPRRH